MLSISKLGADGGGYYLQEHDRMLSEARSSAVEGYMAADAEADFATWWSANGALARTGEAIQPGELEAALKGFGLDGKAQVQQRQGTDRTGGWDLTFSAPKDVSALWATADPQTRLMIQRDVVEAAGAALASLQSAEAFEVRMGKDGAIKAPAADIRAARYLHMTSRAGEPQLHVHCIVPNAALRPDGKTGALHSKALYPWKTYGAAMFRADLARRVERYGLAIEPDGQFFGVAGVSEKLTAAWSSRRSDVEHAADGSEALTGKAKRMARTRAAEKTRGRKTNIPAAETLERRWRTTLSDLGLSGHAVWHAAKDAASQHQRPTQSAGDAALADVLGRRSVVGERELRRVIAEAAQTRGIGADGARAEWERLQRGPLIELGQDRTGERVYSTADVLARERRMLLDARDRIGEGSKVRPAAAEAAIRARPTLSQEQATAIRHVARGDGVVVVEGVAGAGKSFATGALVEAAQASGAEVIGLAPSHQAAAILRRDGGIPDATPIQGFVMRLRDGRAELPGQSLVIVDEAGMASSRDLATLLQHARRSGATVALIGDRRQLASVEPGAPFAAVADVLGVARMETIRRQEIPWMRAATQAMAGGDSAAGLAAYMERGHVVMADGNEEAVRKVADAWEESRRQQPNAERLVLAARNADVHALNTEIRGRLLAAGELGAEALTISTIHSGGGARRGEGHLREMEIRAGDRVVVGAADRTTGILPGDVATLERFEARRDPVLHLRLDRTGERRVVRLSSLAPPGKHAKALPVLQHAHARTIHKSQGATADQVFVHAGAGLDRARAYVAASRHKQGLVMVADANAVRERLNAMEIDATPAAVRTEFLAASRRVEQPQNAGDYLQDRESWLATGHLHKREAQEAAHVATLMRSGAAPRDAKEAARWEAIRQRSAAAQNAPALREQRQVQKQEHRQRQVQRQGRGMSM